MKRLYINNLAYGTTSAVVRELFELYGSLLDVEVVRKEGSRSSAGFGFVTFARDDDADQALLALNNSEVDGRFIHVREAQPQPDRAPLHRIPPQQSGRRNAGDGPRRETHKGGPRRNPGDHHGS